MKSAMRNKRMVKIMNVSKETDKLEVRKRINKLISSARKNAKPKVCELCGSPIDVTTEGRSWVTTQCKKCRTKKMIN